MYSFVMVNNYYLLRRQRNVLTFIKIVLAAILSGQNLTKSCFALHLNDSTTQSTSGQKS